MQANSRTISTNQTEIHSDLEKVVRRHLENPFQHKVKKASLEIFQQIKEMADRHGGELIFDSGCGSGESTVQIAEKHRECFVVGMDKSKERIRKANEKFDAGENYLLLRAEVVDIWHLAVKNDWRLKQHYILYPNPWPKKNHFKRRWHGHPAFTDILALGGEIILRSNWKLYLEELALAAKIATGKSTTVQSISPKNYISLFEKKYFESEQELFELRVNQ